MKCMVCGAEARPCCPLTFCEKCVHTEAADKVREEHERFIRKLIQEAKIEKGMKMLEAKK